ncbi:carboxylesterase/lipase family protein [Microbacterium sp. P03]|uniref:carboxylesterase/lipase family protein n=1 Tax=Microbacterium sp. P03 TaxID=3366946 RepID=UPI0037467FC0
MARRDARGGEPVAHAAPVVDIAPGSVRGFWRGPSAAFLGIPFAQAPVGDLRFAAPVPPEPWTGVRDARENGATAKRAKPGERTLIPEPAIPGESTLNVNVFTPLPGAVDAALPVLVWFHGGGFVEGSPASPWYDGAAFTRDGIVTVSVSYRLGFDGFGAIEDAPSNRGVRDWLAALEWVQTNIRAFGGDPGRVTIAGQSAGGGAVLTLLGMPAAQHLFHAVWALSAVVGDVPAARATALVDRLADLAGVAPTRAGFRSVPEARLLELQDGAASALGTSPFEKLRSTLDEGRAWAPTIDGDLLTRPSPESLRSGIGAGKPLVLGTTDDEFTMATDRARKALRFVPVSLALGRLQKDRGVRNAYLADNAQQRRRGTAAVLGRYATDRIFRAFAVRVADARGDAPTWMYRFSWVSPTIGWACHCLDVPFWWDCLDADAVPGIAGDAPPQALADALHGSAAAFVRGAEPGWEAWSDSRGTTRVFGGEASTADVIPDGYASVRALV